jgi:outer membrane lipoprotein LolB
MGAYFNGFNRLPTMTLIKRVAFRMGIILISLALTACVTAPRRVSITDPLAEQIAREDRAYQQREWFFSGRIAVSRNGDGGQAKIQWQQNQQGMMFVLDAPLGAGQWKLQQDGTIYRLSGFAGGVREGNDPQAMLKEATGFDIPFGALPFWVRGLRTQQSHAIDFAESGLPSAIHDNGWLIQYENWDAQQRPLRLVATQGELRLRLIIDQWNTR